MCRWYRKNSAGTDSVEHRNSSSVESQTDASSLERSSKPKCAISASLGVLLTLSRVKPSCFSVTLKILHVPINGHKARIRCVLIY